MPARGCGTAWLLEDRERGDYICSWYAGPSDGRLAERSASRTYWAGSAPRPEGFAHTWPELAVENGRATC